MTKFKTKSQTIIKTCILRNFYSYRIIIEDKAIVIVQKKLILNDKMTIRSTKKICLY